MKITSVIALVIASVASATAFAGIDVSKLPPAATKQGVTYATDIKPILEASCFRCHGAERPKAGLRLDSLENVLTGGKEGPVVVAGDSVKSPLLIAVSQLDPEFSMPPKPRAGRGPGGPGGRGGPSGARGTKRAQRRPRSTVGWTRWPRWPGRPRRKLPARQAAHARTSRAGARVD